MPLAALPITVVLETSQALVAYASVPVAFQVDSRLRLGTHDGGLGGLSLTEEAVTPYLKDYDALTGTPESWARTWDLAGFGIFAAFIGGVRVGGAMVAPPSTVHALRLPGNRTDAALIVDLRVAPAARGCGVGARLFDHAAAWARAQYCRRLEAETQNVNVPACRFYARQGCELVACDRYAYATAPDEVQLVWAKQLS